ncbi:MBL fold metallo-hydrolase [Streptomyces sp. NPDC004074]|uniref:MBL fold metallo-hydrolase n=1 Tax=unclassified Streptomyces TaxID=2593676 RepID=UPI0033AA705E
MAPRSNPLGRTRPSSRGQGPRPRSRPASLAGDGRARPAWSARSHHTPGHTAGHSAYHLPDRGILITGDALVTAHPTSRRSGPQLLHDMFHTDRSRALDALEAIELVDAEVIAPGHGPAYRGLPKEAVALVRTRAEK